MEVRSQISFRRGRTSFYPSFKPCPYQLRGSLSCHYETLCLSSWNSFRVPHRPPPSRRRKGLPRNDRVPRRVLFSTFSLSLFPPPFKSHFHAKLAVFSLSLSNSRSKFRASSNWTADIYARSEIFRFNIRPEEDFVSLVEPQSMNGGCVVVSPRATTNIYVSWKKFLPVLSVFRNKRSCCRWYSFRGVFAANVINVKKNSSTTISFRAIKYKNGIYTHAKYRRGNGDVSNSRSNPNPSPLPLHTFPRLVKKYNYIYLFILINVIILIII